MADKEESFVYLESASGNLCRVPASKAAEFQARQERIKKGELTPEEEQRAAEMANRMLAEFRKYKQGKK